MNREILFSILKKTAAERNADKAPMLGAALAYYTAFSLTPLLVLAIAIAGFVLGQEAAQGRIFDHMRILIGDQGARAMQDVIQNAHSNRQPV